MNEGRPPVAPWVKAVRFVDRQVTRVFRAHQVFRDELLFAYTPPRLRTEVTALAYSELPAMYGPGSRTFESGLFDWERSALALMMVDSRSRVLIGGIGGGRELYPVAKMAAEVVAFDPSGALVEVARQAAERLGNVSVYQGSYDDLVVGFREQHGPLAEATRLTYDAVILGRGSFAHVTDESERLAVLNALRKIAPRAPLLLSFTLRGASEDLGDSVRARRTLRAVFGRLGGRAVQPGLRYEGRFGFVYRFTEEEIRDLATRAGYRVAEFARSQYAQRDGRPPAHAVLFPEI